MAPEQFLSQATLFVRIDRGWEELFPKVCGSLLNRILAALKQRFGSDQVTAVLRSVGRALVASRDVRRDTALEERLQQVLKVFVEFGGRARVDRSDGTVLIRGTTCPLAAVTGDHTEVCQMMQTMVSAIMGVPVRERCHRGAVPKCCFEFTLSTRKRPRRR